MKKTIISFFISCLSIIAFGQANTYFHDRIDTTLFAIADTVGHGSNHYYATNLTPDFNVKQYVNGCTVNLFFKKGNTGSATLTLVTKTGTLSSKTIRKANGQVLLSGDIPDSTAVILDYYNGSFRIAGIGVTASSSSWLLTGNSGTTPGTDFVGTIDAKDLVVKRNSIQRIRLGSNNVFEADSGGIKRVFMIYPGGQVLVRTADTIAKNTFIGDSCGIHTSYNHSGSHEHDDALSNTALGYHAMYSNTLGGENVAVGADALYSNTTGGANISIGNFSMRAGIKCLRNIAIGEDAYSVDTAGIDNIAIGYHALNAGIAAGDAMRQNIAIGSSALNDTRSDNDIGIGYASLSANTLGGENVAVGSNTLQNNKLGNYNTAIGSHALQNDTNHTGLSTAVGAYSLTNVKNGIENTGVGYQVGMGVTTGNYNNLFGAATFGQITTGSGNSGFGDNSGYNFLGASSYNTVIGFSAGQGTNRTASGNTYVGSFSGTSSTGSYNVFIGMQAGYYETGGSKLFIDNDSRASEADARKKALIYGGFGVDSSTQFIKVNGEIRFTKGIDASAGDAATVQGQVGQFVKDASGTTFTLTNALIKSNSIILLTWAGDPGGGTAHDISVVAGTGSAVITFGAAPSGSTAVNFAIFNNN